VLLNPFSLEVKLQTKAKIDLKAGVVELEGSEEFVRLHLEKFSAMFQVGTPHRQESELGASAPPTPGEPLPVATKRKPRSKVPAVSRASKGPTKSKRIEPARFDIHKSGSTASLEDFLKEKNPKSAGDVIAVIGYYLTQMKGAPSFSEGNIEYAYRTLQLKGRPTHLRQIIINKKNQKDLFEHAGEDGSWTLTRSGEIYVDEKLPAKDE
jgi:hypothetical protein